MPEYPDIVVYLERLQVHLAGATLENVRLHSPFLLRTVEPPLETLVGREILGFERIGKRLVFAFSGDVFLVLHLMIAGRLRWRDKGCAIPGKIGLAAFDFANGTLLLTEVGTRKLAAMHLVAGRAALRQFDAGGLEVMQASLPAFQERLQSENHTLKRALTDPHLFSGIGNAYSDEILHRARLSPFKITTKMTAGEVERLFAATRAILQEWAQRLRDEVGDGFPEKVTAFHPRMAVHGRYRQPCPVCGGKIQRLRYATNEANYCPNCQTDGKLLADRSLSRLLKKDWPKTPDELERLRSMQK